MIEIFNSQGKRVLKRQGKNISNDHMIFDLSTESAGLYWMKIHTENGSTTKKLNLLN